MKFFFIFLLFMPMVSALAVSPTSLNYGYVEDYEVRDLLVVNNLDEKAEYSLVFNEGESVELNPGEKHIFSIVINSSVYNDRVLYVNEVVEDSSLINSVKIPLKYSVNVEKVVTINNKVNFEDVKVEEVKENVKKRDYAKIIFYSLMGIITIIFLITKFK